MKVFLEEWQKFWKELDANQKVTLFFAGLIVLAGTVAIVMWSQRPEMRLLYGSVNDKDAAAIVAHLDSMGIPYEIRAGGSAIYVPEKLVHRARMDVVSQGIIQGDSVGFEIFDRTSFGVSDFIQRTNFIRAVQGELARTITQLRGVHSARVMVVIPDNRLLLVSDNVATTASVFVDVGGGTLSASAVKSIQSLVANAVEGLISANVAVVDNHGNVLSEDRERDALMLSSSSVMEFRQSMETYFADKVESMLERIVGRGNVVVRVAAEVDSDQVSRLEERFDRASSVVRSQRTQEETRSTVGGTPSGVAFMVLDDAASTGTPSRTDEETRNREQEFEIDRTVTNIVRAPGSVRRVTASVFVAPLTQRVGTGEAATVEVINRTPEQIQNLREMVATALGISLDSPDMGTVTVQETLFAGDQHSQFASHALAGPIDLTLWMKFGEEILGSIIALILFLVFLTLYRKSRSQSNPFEELNHRVEALSRQNNNALTAQNVTPELLNELIRQKPDNAGTTLRNWLAGKSTE